MNAHQRAEDRGLTRDRLEEALRTEKNFGALVNAFEILTAANALLATWPTSGPSPAERRTIAEAVRSEARICDSGIGGKYARVRQGLRLADLADLIDPTC